MKRLLRRSGEGTELDVGQHVGRDAVALARAIAARSKHTPFARGSQPLALFEAAVIANRLFAAAARIALQVFERALPGQRALAGA